ncbi:MAG: hypothetical protein AB7N71_11085 [Phycisphaerae bacterium]
MQIPNIRFAALVRVTVVGFLGTMTISGCGDLSAATDSFFVRGEPFVISGTFAIVDNGNGPCPVWFGDNGATYHLFQAARVTNADFDAATTPGARSRLEIAPRNDLFLACEVGTIVEVQRVLEVVD